VRLAQGQYNFATMLEAGDGVAQDQIEALNFADNLQHSNLDQLFHQIMYERHYNHMTVELWWRKRTILNYFHAEQLSWSEWSSREKLAIGYALFSIATDFATVTPWVILSSMGYHTWLQTQHALAMSVTTEDKSGAILGHVTALGNLGGLVAMVIMAIGFYLKIMTFASAFWLTGLAALAAGIMIFSFPSLRNGVPHEVTTKREPIVVHKDYRFYYMLNLLDGGRQQIFFSFGLWVLAHKFNLDVTHLTMILIGVNLVNTLIGRRVGKLIDRFGERPMLAAANILYVVALTGYAFSDNIWVLVACYTVYSVIFPISWVGANTYLRKIASHQDVAPSIAMGLTMQHVAAVIVPLATGYILNFYGYQIPFMIACAFAVITMISTRFINPATQKSSSRLAEDAAAA
jgi:predicted MFS family arabinose efflux permease